MNLMNMESVAWRTLSRQTHARGGDLHSLANRALLSRIWHFAARHHRRLGGFVGVSVISALLGVATPLLAGKVVDAIVSGGAPSVVVTLAAVIAAVADRGDRRVVADALAVLHHRRRSDP